MDFLVYFQRYMELFNRDDLPEPKSILLATAEANILSAVATAREYFNHFMMEVFERNEPYLTSHELEDGYATGNAQAIKQFDEKPKMGVDELVHRYRAKLIEDIKSDYNHFKIFNAGRTEANIQRGFAAGKESYSRNMASACASVEPYLCVDEFKETHEKSAQMALIEFRNYCKAGGNDISDPYQEKLEQDIIIERDRFIAFNKNKAEANNRAAIVVSKGIYHKKMSELIQNFKNTYISLENLNQMHVECKTEAIERFSNSTPNGDEFSVTFKTILEKDIDNDYKYFKSLNKNKKESYILSTTAEVKETYHRNMSAICEAAYPYLTNHEMEENHVRFQTEAMQKITANQEFPESYKLNLRDFIIGDYQQFKHQNRSKAEAHNQLAFSSAKDAYHRQMTIFFEGHLTHFTADEFDQQHQKCKAAALKQFTNQCKKYPDEFSETHFIKLDQEIEIHRNWFKNHNETKANLVNKINSRRSSGGGLCIIL